MIFNNAFGRFFKMAGIRVTQQGPSEAEGTPEGGGVTHEWIANTYFATLSEEISHALDQLHQATNWGVTLVTGALIAILARAEFPDFPSLLALLGLAALNAHFMNRALRGYINVVRFGLLQKLILSEMQPGPGALKTNKEIWAAIAAYHISWRSPLNRRHVYWKGLAELGFGYLFIILGALVVVCLDARVIHQPSSWVWIGVAVLLLVLEIGTFSRSPYLRTVEVNSIARQQR